MPNCSGKLINYTINLTSPIGEDSDSLRLFKPPIGCGGARPNDDS